MRQQPDIECIDGPLAGRTFACQPAIVVGTMEPARFRFDFYRRVFDDDGTAVYRFWGSRTREVAAA